MLLKYTQAQKRIKATGIGKPQRTAGGMVKISSGLVSVVPKIHRKVIKVASKRPVTIHRTSTGVKREHIPVDPCDNSNDSGLGFDHHLDYHTSLATHSALRFSDKEAAWQTEESPEVKRRRLEIKLESDDANDNFTFPETVRPQPNRAICVPVRGRSRVVVPLTLTSQLSSTSQNGLVELLMVCQPEQQHRARYQTEGSRGAVKDRTGNGFPVVKLVGYDRPATLQVFIGTDQGRVAPHMFYQACRVSGKNSTPCIEKKIDGTIVIEVDVEPSKDMVVTCDCVGILKERNVDVEHRFPEEGSGRSKKKSTRCRMVFRTVITNQDGTQETLQITSQPIVCTQPPGVPEICKKSLSSCSVQGGQELFILGKNFLKDTRVVFQEGEGSSPSWSQSVQPDKEFLQQSHLVCVVPAYQTTDISEPVSVRLVVESSGKASEPHTFLYLPDTMRPAENSVLAPDGNIVNNSVIAQGGSTGVFSSHLPVTTPLLLPPEPAAVFMANQTSPRAEEKMHPVMIWDKPVDVMMPPPSPSMLPITVRRSSVQMIVPDSLAPENMKREVPETIMDPPKPMANVSDLSSTQPPSMDTFHRFVSNNSLPSINVGNYLSSIEGNSIYANKVIKSQILNEIPRIMIPSQTSVNKPMLPVDSSNLLTTVEPILVNQSAAMPFDGRNMSVNAPASQPSQENLSVIVNSSMIQKKPSDMHTSQDVQQHKQISECQNVGLDILMSSTMSKRAPTMTERLDAFVNSAAESHISPTPSSPITMTSVITENSVLASVNEMAGNGTEELNKLQKTNIPTMVQTSSLPISPHTSSHHGQNMSGGSLCSLLNSTVQASSQSSSNQAQSVSNIQANISNLIPSPTQVSTNQSQSFSDLQASLRQQLSSQSVTSSQISHGEMNSLMQSPSQVANQTHTLSNLQASLEQQLSPQTISSTQLNHSDLNNIMQSSPQTSKNQGQGLSNLQVSIEQQLSSQTMNSSQINPCNLNNLMQSPPHNSRNEAQALSNLQVSLEQHLSSQPMNSTQIIHPDTVESGNLSLNSMGRAIQAASQSSTNEVQALSNLQASIEHHLSSQVIGSAQDNHETLTNESITLSNLSSTMTTSPQIHAVVSQAQALSDFQASLEHHLSSKVMGSTQPILESMTQNSHSPNSLNSSMENSSQVVVSQPQTLSLQMSLGHLTSQVLTSPQQNHQSITSGTLSLNNSIQTSSAQTVVSQAQVFSNIQASLEHHLTSEVIGTTQPTSDSLLPLERLSDSIQNSPPPSSNQTLSSLQASMEHLSSQVLSSAQSSHNDNLASNSLSVNDAPSIDLTGTMSLINSQTINVSNTSPVSNATMISSPNAHHSPTSVLTSPRISPTNLTMHNSQTVDMNTPNIVLSTPQSLLATDISMNNSSTLALTPSDLLMQTSQNGPLQQNNVGQFERVTSNISQRIPVQVTTMNQYEQCREIQSTNKEPERKDSSPFMMPSEAVMVQPQPSFEMKQQAPAQTVKKCEEGMPVPHELTQMSEHDLISYINPSCFDTV